MKRKIIFLTAILTLILLLLPACDARQYGSLKSLTKPYIAQYECTEAKLGEQDLLERFDYIEINLEPKNKMQVIYKPKDGKKNIVESRYSFDVKSHELTAEIGILGYNFKEATVVENGKFTLTKTIGDRQLIMKFKAK